MLSHRGRSPWDNHHIPTCAQITENSENCPQDVKEENIKSAKEVLWDSWASNEELWLRGWWNVGLEAEQM